MKAKNPATADPRLRSVADGIYVNRATGTVRRSLASFRRAGVPFICVTGGVVSFVLKDISEYRAVETFGHVALDKVMDNWPHGLEEVVAEIVHHPWCEWEHVVALVGMAKRKHGEAERAKTSR